VAAAPGAATAPRWPALLLVAILALAAWLQFTVVVHTEVAAPLRADASDYFAYASNLREFGVYSRAPLWRDAQARIVADKERPPGYPIFLRLAGRPEPSDAWLLRVGLLQAGLGVFTVAFAYLIAAAWLRPAFALLATLLCAINPWLATANVYLLTESLFTFMLFASAWMSMRALAPESGAGHALFAGAAWGLCSLVRPTMQYLPLALLLGTLLLPSWRRWHRPAALGLLAFALVLSPWWLRNAFVAPPAGSTDLMVNGIVHGSYPGFRYRGREDSYGYPYRHDPGAAAASRDLPSALAFVAAKARDNPLEYARWYLFGKPYYFLSLEDVQSFDIQVFPLRSSPYYERFEFAMLRIASYRLHWPLVLSGLSAMFALAFAPALLRLPPPQRRACALLALVLAYAIALHMLAAPFPRYAVPFRPLLYALALLPLQAGLDAWRARSRRADLLT
jgi:4-amino-4-deoxy-L-arabinose transferase-like glycosyltransferase